MRLDQSARWFQSATLTTIAIVLSLASTSLQAGDEISGPESTASTHPENDAPVDRPAASTTRAAIRSIIERETAATGLPPDIAEAVVFVESGYDQTVVGRVGEIGLMQIRPETAAMLGFRGSSTELATPETNIHYGVIYLSRAWKLAGGDLCRALMKYRAGHGEETMSPRSQIYCNRARDRLLAMNSVLAPPQAVAATTPVAAVATKAEPASQPPIHPANVYARYRQGTAAASRAYWAAHEAMIRQIKARIEAKWKRVASR